MDFLCKCNKISEKYENPGNAEKSGKNKKYLGNQVMNTKHECEALQYEPLTTLTTKCRKKSILFIGRLVVVFL